MTPEERGGLWVVLWIVVGLAVAAALAVVDVWPGGR